MIKRNFVIIVKPQWMAWLVKWVSPSLLYIKVIPKKVPNKADD